MIELTIVFVVVIFIYIGIYYVLKDRAEPQIEGFAYLLDQETGDFKPVEQLNYNLKKDLLLDTPIQGYHYCKELCETGDRCIRSCSR